MRQEPTLGDILHHLWQARLWLFGGGLAGLGCAFLFLTLAVPHYRATMLVAPATRSGMPDISVMFPDTPDFAVERMLKSFGLGESSDFTRFEAILKEQTVAGLLLEDEKIRSGFAESERFWFGDEPEPRTAAEMTVWLKDRLAVEPAGATRIRRVSFSHADPAFAVYFLHRLYEIADTLIRQEVQYKTKSRVGWLKEALAQTGHPEHRRVLTNLLMNQEQIRMVLAADEPFSALLAEPPALLAEPPAVGAKPAWPRRALVIPAFVFAGLFLAYAAFSLRPRRA